MPDQLNGAYVDEFKFGRSGNVFPYLGPGWASPEAEGSWAIGTESSLSLPGSLWEREFGIQIEVTPFILSPSIQFQSLEMLIDGKLIGSARIQEKTVLCFVIPQLNQSKIMIDFRHANAAVPSELDSSLLDGRCLALFYRSLRLITLPENFFCPTGGSSALRLRTVDRNNVDSATAALEQIVGVKAADFLGQFESSGVDCEFGLVQRACGAEPLGLLRFSTVHILPLVKGLIEDFSRLGDEKSLSFTVDPSGEYIAHERNYQLRYHTFVNRGDATEHQMMARELKKLTFLRRKLLEQLQEGYKIFVYKCFHQVELPVILPVFFALNVKGRNTLLWVSLACEHHVAGSVEEIRPGLLRGYMSNFSSPIAGIHARDVSCWLEVCLNAASLSPQVFSSFLASNCAAVNSSSVPPGQGDV